MLSNMKNIYLSYFLDNRIQKEEKEEEEKID
jgi:hypothetical protein